MLTASKIYFIFSVDVENRDERTNGCELSLLGRDGYNRDVAAVEKVFVGIGGVGLLVDKPAGQPVEWISRRVNISFIFLAPVSPGGTADTRAERNNLRGDVDVEPGHRWQTAQIDHA